MNFVREEDIQNIIARIPYQECEGKTFLITGASGFIASYMVDTLMYLNRFLKEKCTVIALCRNVNKAKDVFKEYLNLPSFKLFFQSVEKEIDLEEKADYIIHAACSSSSLKQKQIPAEILSCNTVGTYQALEYAKKVGIKSFLFLSSGAVYGRMPEEIEEITEKDSFYIDFADARNCYAEGKRAGEALCATYWKQYGVPTKSIRISHTYGPGIDLDDGHVYSDFARNICLNENLKIKGDGTDARPFCYIVDALVASFLVLFCGESGESYNMANQKENLSIRELAEKLTKEAFPERKLRIECKNCSDSVGKKILINTDKLEKLGWKPTIDAVEGFRRTVKSFEDGEKVHD